MENGKNRTGGSSWNPMDETGLNGTTFNPFKFADFPGPKKMGGPRAGDIFSDDTSWADGHFPKGGLTEDISDSLPKLGPPYPHEDGKGDYIRQIEELIKKSAALNEPRGCFCVGRQNGDPHCPCEMRRRGLPMNKQEQHRNESYSSSTKKESNMASIEKDTLVFRFPEIHEKAVLKVTFHRTLRIPDDNREYPLPPNLGNFPLGHVDDFADKVPAEWQKRGGIMMPMWQSEAMWVSFSAEDGYPFAVKIAAGKINAVSGEEWDEELVVSDKTVTRTYPQEDASQDYMTVPKQPWLDGFHVDPKHVRQFVSMPLGKGYTVEEQITGKAEFGGLQIIVYPMKAEEAKKHIVRRPITRSLMGSMGSYGESASSKGLFMCCASASASLSDSREETVMDMGLAAGGLMKQQIFADPYTGDVWEKNVKQRCFVHLLNSVGYELITGKKPPTKPFGQSDYAYRNYPWFDYYDDGAVLGGSDKLRQVDSVAALGIKKGETPLPENAPFVIPPEKVVKLGKKGVVRDGKW